MTCYPAADFVPKADRIITGHLIFVFVESLFTIANIGNGASPSTGEEQRNAAGVYRMKCCLAISKVRHQPST